MRVGTTLYKVVNQPCANGGYEKKRVVWNNSTLRQDYGKNYLATVPKYDGFCTVPNHLNYQKEIEGFLNLYEPIEHKPQQGDFSHIQSLMRHIFGEQYELGMDYMQLLYLQPTQKLPIVLLVSEERNTGKSTFLNFLKAVFENNVTFNTNEDFRSQFNSDWAGKLPELSGAGRTGLHRIELRIECKQGSLSVGQLRTHPLLFRQRPCRTGSTPANPHGIRQRAVHPGRFADLQRMQGLERILTETD